MTTVFAQMSRDTVGPSIFGQFRGAQWIRVRSATRIPHGGHVVNIDAKSEGSGVAHANLHNLIKFTLVGRSRLTSEKRRNSRRCHE